MNILVLNTLDDYNFKTFFTDRARAKLEQLGTVRYMKFSNTPDDAAALKERIRDVDVMFTQWGASAEHSGFDKDFYSAAKRLKMIAHTGGSVADLINEEMQKREDFVLLSGNRYYAESVAQGTICYMLLSQRRLYETLKETEKNGWAYRTTRNDGLRGKTIGLVSFGMIAKELARMLRVFDCKVKVYSGHGVSAEEQKLYAVESCSLEELFSTCDIVSVHSGLTAKTHHMIDGKLLALMKDDALLVNTSRGAVIDEQALEKEVRAGRIRAVLDVFEVEPLPIDSGLRNLDNVIIVPHNGGPTIDVRELVTLGLIDDVERYFNGNRKLENQITMEYAKNMTNHAIVEKTSDRQEAK